MRHKLQCREVLPIFVGELVGLGLMIFLETNITCQRAIRDVGDRILTEQSVNLAFRFDAFQ